MAVGYVYNQLTGDSGSGATLGEYKSRIAALGPQIGFLFPVDVRFLPTLGVIGNSLKPVIRPGYVVGLYICTEGDGSDQIACALLSGAARPRIGPYTDTKRPYNRANRNSQS